MIAMIKKISIVFLICVIISCAFSTVGNNVRMPKNNTSSLVQDTVIKYVERPPLTPAQRKLQDSLMRNYIGSIIKPYADGVQSSNQKSISDLSESFKRQSDRIDSINTLRDRDRLAFQKASEARDSILLQSLIKDRRIELLQQSIAQVEKNSIDATKLMDNINKGITFISDIAIYAFIGIGLALLFLNITVECLKNKKKRKYSYIKNDE